MKQLKNAIRGKHKLIFIDFEGTQFTHEIIAAGICKLVIDDDLNIIEEDNFGKLIYTKARSSIGKVVTKLTSITEEFLKENGISFYDTINEIEEYVGNDLDDTLFVCFGNNDPKMLIESCRFSHPDNADTAKKWAHNFFDFMTFASQFIRDEKGNTYSLVNFLKLFNLEPHGESHNPLNDALDLKNFFKAFIVNKEVRFNEYQKVLANFKAVPSPIQKVINDLEQGKEVTPEDFKQYIRDFLA